MKRNKKIYSAITGIILSLSLINFTHVKVLAEGNTEAALDIGKQLVKEYYIEEIPDAKLNEAKSVDNLIKSLNDPYSSYFTENEYNDFNNSLNNSFAGIGVQIEAAAEGIKIVAVYDKSPALEAGLKAGDIIIKAEDRSLAGMSTEEAITYIKGEAGTKVKLQIKRGNEIIDFQVERRQIVLPTVVGEVLDNHIGYIRVSSFGENTIVEFKNQLKKVTTNSTDSFIIDLRNNPGGYMNVAFDMAGYFIGDKVVMKSHSKLEETITYKAIAHNELIDKPVIFLINHYSASASEILSAAIKDYKKAFFIGEKTYGKGVGQSLFMLPGNSYIKLTTFRFVSPLENEINKVGISPDLVIKDNFEQDIDSLKAATILLNSLSPKEDKSGTVKAVLAGKEFEVDLSNAKNDKNINTFKYMAANAFNENTIFAGSKNGWEKLGQEIALKDFLFGAEVTPPVKTEPEVKAEVEQPKAEQQVKVFANVAVLPNTGSKVDMSFYIGLGMLFVIAGVKLKNN